MVKNLKLLDKALQLLPEVKETVGKYNFPLQNSGY